MFLIADSGSTKTDWILLKEDNSQKHFFTAGFNPFFHNEKFIYSEISRQKEMKSHSEKIKEIFFYGAGCSSAERNNIIKRGLQKFFSKAKITVEHDLTAAAYSVYEGEPCIAAIAGTGSNSCYFDGKKIYEEIPALGYILGDEGSGSYFGKILLKKFLYNQLPEKISQKLQKEESLTKEKIFENVYQKPNANVYLASFFRILAEHKNEKFIREIISVGMKDFLENHVCCFKNYRQVKTHFVGSVGFIFEDILRQTAQSMEISIGKVIKQPIHGLVNYHLQKSQ